MLRLSMKGMAIAGGLLWGAAILCVGVIHLVVPDYGTNFLQAMSSVYPGLHYAKTVISLAIGTVEGLIDGAISGFILALLCNTFAHAKTEA